MNILKPLVRVFSPPMGSARLSILIFHRVLAQPDPVFPGEFDAARFDRALAWLNELFTVLPLDEAVQRARSGTLPARAAAITFDDGYADNHDIALPILRKHRNSATFFIATDFLDGGRMWNDSIIAAIRNAPTAELNLDSIGLGRLSVGSVEQKRAAIGALLGRLKYLPNDERTETVARVVALSSSAMPSDLMMSSDQVLQLHRNGMIIGAHTRSHPILSSLSSGEALAEIRDGRARLESIVGTRVGLFAYPNGKPGQDYRSEHVDMVKTLGFDAAVSTAWGALRPGTDYFQIPRFTPWDKTRFRFGVRMLNNLFQPS